MYSYVVFGLASLSLLYISKQWASLNQNIAIAKASGITYRVSFVNGLPGYLWIAVHNLILGPLHSFKPSRKWLWPKLIHVHRSWHYSQEMREELGEVYLIITPSQIFMSSSNAQATMQMISRRTDFVKPVEIYAIVDIFGSSILTTEGNDWKRHRRIVAPAFSEKSNALVWKETLRQTLGMINVWKNLEGNASSDMAVKDTAPYTALMALHVICSAGFGVRQLWDGESENQLGNKVLPGFNTAKLTGKHSLTFKDSLNTLLHGIIWLAIFPVDVLKKSPFELHKKLLKAYFECGDYFKELSEYKIQQINRGESAEKGTMDIMGPLVTASERSSDDPKGTYLTKQEMVADSWIMLFAGHETSANITHYCFLFLAIELEKQAHLQKDIDSIVGSRPLEEWTYETDLASLWNSMLGASVNETLRLMPPVIDIPKVVRSVPQPLNYEDKKVTIPAGTTIHISAVGLHRNPRYWPHEPSKVSNRSHDLDDWIPERWLRNSPNKSAPTSSDGKVAASEPKPEIEENTTTFDTPTGLYIPQKGAFMPFSEGARACPGKRFAQVEITAVLAAIFRSYSLELDVREWASDERLEKMSNAEKKAVYAKAMKKAGDLIKGSQSEIFLTMRGEYPVRFVQRGRERFMGVVA